MERETKNVEDTFEEKEPLKEPGTKGEPPRGGGRMVREVGEREML